MGAQSGHFHHAGATLRMDFPQIPNTHALAMLLMTGVALFLFTREKIRLETSSLTILMLVVIGFEIFPI